MLTQITEQTVSNQDKEFSELLDKLTTLDPDFVCFDNNKGNYLIRLKNNLLVIAWKYSDEFDYMRLDRALRARITERGWLYGIGLMSSAILSTKLARVCIPSSKDLSSPPYIPRPLWIWESHEEEDAIALLRAYCRAVEKIEELMAHANNQVA
jgi:hypothetical protein